MKGVVQSGGTPQHVVTETPTSLPIIALANVQVTLWDSAKSQPVTQTTTDGDGSFYLNTSDTTSDGIFYVTADAGNGVLLLTLVGRELLPEIRINELTTICGCYCVAQFLDGASIQGNAQPLRIAVGMNTNLVNVVDGRLSQVIWNAPNGAQTNTSVAIYSLANMLASCVRAPNEFLDKFFRLAGITATSPSRTTIAGVGNIARKPAKNVGGIYALSKAMPCYEPALLFQPDAWTIVVKVNETGGTDDQMFGGPGSLAFDSNGRAWIPNNVIQGSGQSAPYSIVLEADGRPAPFSPLTGGGILGPGFGVAIGRDDRVWIGDFGWGGSDYWPPGSVSLFRSDGAPLSPSEGFLGGVHRVQGVAIDSDDNVWLASFGSGQVFVYPKGDANRAVGYPTAANTEYKPFGVAIASDGTAWVTNSGAEGGIARFRFDGTTITKLFEMQIGKVTKGVVIDSIGNIWVASGSDDHVYLFDSNGNLLGGYQGGGTNGPWGLTLDGDDNVWVGNFGPLEPGSVFHGRLTQLASANDATREPGYRAGDGMSPQSGYTLPTGGSAVTLPNGQGLYGENGPACYIPMMRTTGLDIDAAGNVWTCNNWKPNFDLDWFGDPFKDTAPNPGGDGMVIWIGVAKPRV